MTTSCFGKGTVYKFEFCLSHQLSNFVHRGPRDKKASCVVPRHLDAKAVRCPVANVPFGICKRSPSKWDTTNRGSGFLSQLTKTCIRKELTPRASFRQLYGSTVPVKVVQIKRGASRRVFFFCGSTLTVLAEPGTGLVRKARRDFQPEISASTFNRKPRARRSPSRWREIQKYNFKIYR